MTVLLLFVLYAILLSIALARRGFRSPTPPSAKASGTLRQRLLIVGGTGGTGRELVEQALERGHQVTALVRDPAKLKIEHPKLRIVQGDVLDFSSVQEAVRGQDAVISTLGHRRYFSAAGILSKGTSNLLRAMESHRVSRFVCITSLGIGDSAGGMGLYYTFFVIPAILPLYFFDKARQERLIAASALDWVIVRPGLLTNGERRRTYRHGSKVGNFLLTVRISRADVAEFVLDQTANDGYLRTAPGVAW